MKHLNQGIRNGPLAQLIDRGQNAGYSNYVLKSFTPKAPPKTGFKLPELPLSSGNTWEKLKEQK